MIPKYVIDESIDNGSNRPDDPCNIPFEAEKAPDQVQACDSRPENAHNCSDRFVLIMCGLLLGWNKISAYSSALIQLEQAVISAVFGAGKDDHKYTDRNNDQDKCTGKVFQKTIGKIQTVNDGRRHCT